MTEINKELKCRFCAKISTTKGNCKKHEDVCKLAEDPICYLQMTRGVDIGEYKHTECRFCDHDFKHRSAYLCHITSKTACKSKNLYGRGLMDGIATNIIKQYVTDNRTTNNVVNNFYILTPYKNTDYRIDGDGDLQALLEDLANDNDLHKHDISKYEAPINHMLRVHSKDENKNIKCTNEKKNTMLVFNDGNFKKDKDINILAGAIDKVKIPIEQACKMSGGAALVAGERLLDHLDSKKKSNRLRYVKNHASSFRRGISNIDHGDAVNIDK
jgi:hypothetical protein